MSDIVDWLRDRAETEATTDNANPSGHIDWIAADEILRLRAESEKLREERDLLHAILTNVSLSMEAFDVNAAIREGEKNEKV